jgi:hypothetical protein
MTESWIEGEGPFRFVDSAVSAGRMYLYRLEAVSGSGSGSQFFGPIAATVLSRPLVLALHRNVPNPFNPTTRISYELPAAANVRLTVYDAGGRSVRRLDHGRREGGLYEVIWGARDDRGTRVGAGIYFYRLEVGEWVRARKMLLLP